MIVSSRTKNQGVSKFVFFRFCNQQAGGEAPSPQEGASRRRNLIYIDSPVPACKAGLREICRSNLSVGSNFEKLSELSDYHHYLFFLLFRPENLTLQPTAPLLYKHLIMARQ